MIATRLGICSVWHVLSEVEECLPPLAAVQYDKQKTVDQMDNEAEETIVKALTLRAKGGDSDAARILFNEKSKRVRAVRFHQCQSLDELKLEFETYMGLPDITKAESEHATKAFDRLFKIIVARDTQAKRAEGQLLQSSGIMMIPMIDPNSWAEVAAKSQRDLKEFARV